MKKFIAILVLTLAVVSVLLKAQAQERRFRFQGVLFDVLQDIPLEGEQSLTLTFKIYDSESSTTALWQETHGNVPIDNGFIDVELGEYSNLDGLAFDKQYWLGIEVESDGEMQPRIQLTPVPYAIKAE